jgi:heat shock protein HslJ
MKTLKPLVALLLVTAFASACGDTRSTPTSPSSSSSSSAGAGSSSPEPATAADQLAGAWTLASVHPAGQSAQATPAGASYTLTFAGGRLSTRVDCNTCNGTFMLSGDTLMAGPSLACTRAACPTDAFGNAYTTVLSGQSTVLASERTLELSSARGALRFTR